MIMQYFNPDVGEQMYDFTCKAVRFKFSHWENTNKIRRENWKGGVPNLDVVGAKVVINNVADTEPLVIIRADNPQQLERSILQLQKVAGCEFVEAEYGK
jgi:hypothetical protein